MTAAVAGTGRPALVRWRWTVTTAFGLLASTPVLQWLGSRRSLAGALLLIAAAMAVMGLARAVHR